LRAQEQLMPIKSLAVLLVALLLGHGQAQASVVMGGTRVIYHADAREKTLQLSNTDNHPNLVQIWLDRGNAASTLETADAPFVASPQIFRMEPHAGQMVRLIFTGEALPQDRESVFYLNFSQVPALKASEHDANKLVLMFSSRLKVFYRPKGLAGTPNDMAKQFNVRRVGNAVEVDNPTGYHGVLRGASLVVNGKALPLAESQLLDPASQTRWPLPDGAGNARDALLRLTLVNDYGVDVIHELPLH